MNIFAYSYKMCIFQKEVLVSLELVLSVYVFYRMLIQCTNTSINLDAMNISSGSN